MLRRQCAALLCVVLLLPAMSCAADSTTVKLFQVKTSADAPEIDNEKDHFDLVFVAGQISQKDSIWRSIISKQNKLSATINATGTYFDGDALKNAWIIENTDISRVFNGSWGVASKTLLQAIPADTANVSIDLTVADYKDDRIQQLLGAVKSSEPSLGIAVEPYATYATVVSNVMSAAFDPAKTSFPFKITAGVNDGSVTSTNGMYEHYIVAVAYHDESDSMLQWDESKITVTRGGTLNYDGKPVTDHSFAILSVRKAPSPNIDKLVFSSQAPWAVLAKNSFVTPPPLHVATQADVASADAAQSANLSTCEDLLKKELRFSAVDRAAAIDSFATQAKKYIAKAFLSR